MEVTERFLLHHDSFVTDYIMGDKRATSLFDYGLSATEEKKRLQELRNKKDSFDREALYHHLYTYNKQFLYSDNSLKQVEKLKHSDAVVVVGGQQAGLLTGPMYTISKGLTIVKEAERLEETHGIPVVPIFWIAGEDHDWEEVNHIYYPVQNKIEKHTYEGFYYPGQPISLQPLDQEKFHLWFHQFMESIPETAFSKAIQKMIASCIERAKTVTEFFGELMSWLFRDSGLVLLDSNHLELRQLEKDIFQKLIAQNERVTEAVRAGVERRKRHYSIPAGISFDSAHLFYHDKHGRELLYQNEERRFINKRNNLTFTTDELLTLHQKEPERFSTNVMTRPLVQEALLPVLSFIAGPGEINYWSLLRPLFHIFHMKVPPVQPRYEWTIVPRQIQSTLRKEQLSLKEWIETGGFSYEETIRKEMVQIDGFHLAENLLHVMAPYHDEMKQSWEQIAPSEKSVGEKNWKRIEKEVYFFAKKINKAQEMRESRRFERIQQCRMFLHPLNKPQERILNVFYFVNEYGLDFISGLQTLSFPHKSEHTVIFL
ncbi:bacillithiol biosynthesis cysteine-adding enzyme BshC [Aliibacillus thermotolerans]|uniref:Putative cysteine ligase BshC n=1 Tax=Aliibacillus thermotolerans TaxID=1834418 RepID=A0ABW0U2T5_9BACI|nr:bacillithiol biosynthesis cysteine-adding enzyme BshC [Aliibacillus thermotolerans]MDA3131013.1 bacillithiol biosynthesis cysteine-adding enzyme BshC [Aliibacillus thermotolerans]